MLKSFGYHLVFIHIQLKLCILVLQAFLHVHFVLLATLERKT